MRGWVLFHLLCLLFVFTRLFAGAVCFRLRSLVCTFSAVVVVLLLVLFVLLVCARLFAVCLVLRVFVCVVSAFIVFFFVTVMIVFRVMFLLLVILCLHIDVSGNHSFDNISFLKNRIISFLFLFHV